MHQDYNDWIENCGQHLFEKLFTNESHQTLAPQLDSILREIVFHFNHFVSKRVLNALVKEKVKELKQQGFSLRKTNVTTFQMLHGAIPVPSHYLQHPKTKQGVNSLKSLGMSAKGKSPELQRALVDFGSEESFEQATQRFKEHYLWEIGASSLRDATLTHAKKALDFVEKHPTQAHSSQNVVQTMFAQTDGCNIRTGYLTPLPNRAGGKKKRVEKWKEVRIGLLRNQGDVQKHYVAKMASYQEICNDLSKLADWKGRTHRTQIVGIADGGHGIKEEMASHFEPFHFILYFYHLKENLFETADKKGLVENEKKKWVDEKMELIWHGKIKKVIEDLKGKELFSDSYDRVNRLIGYLTRFEENVHYEDYRNKDWPIGSGEVESAHRSLPQKRLKLPGAWWKKENVNPMLALRVIRANEWWADYWEQQQIVMEAV